MKSGDRLKRTTLKDRVLPSYTKGEEIFNMVSHLLGGVLGIASLILCVAAAALHKNTYGVVSGAIFGFSMIVLYTMSSIYHGLKPDKMAKKVFQVIDHCSIFILIAGTYTPIALCSLREYSAALGWAIFGIIWGAAILGITLNSIDIKSFRVFSLICYIAMGWCIVAVAKQTYLAIGKGGIIYLVTGGLLYTAGAILYVMGKRKKYFHSVFHLFVVGGSLFHFLCILLYIM